ncbi:hypothetical protein QJQ45_012950 [Haematococcus lacustris]|nr:hypothetical protein QJQ45_012950 [Haematococcus lacustris]
MRCRSKYTSFSLFTVLQQSRQAQPSQNTPVNAQNHRVVLVDEHRTSRVSSAVNGQQPCERQLNKRRPTRPADWKPPAGQVHHRLVRPAWSQQRDQPVRGMMWCPVVAPRKPPQAPRSSQEATQAAASEPGPSTPLPAKHSKRTEAEPAAEPTKVKGKAAKAKPAPQPGRWLDRDCNAALNMQRIGESKWRPLELCWWPQQAALPAKGKEYPGLGYKRLRDKPPKAQQQQQPAEAHSARCPSYAVAGLALVAGLARCSLGYKRLRDKPPKAQEQQQPAEAQSELAAARLQISKLQEELGEQKALNSGLHGELRMFTALATRLTAQLQPDKAGTAQAAAGAATATVVSMASCECDAPENAAMAQAASPAPADVCSMTTSHTNE